MTTLTGAELIASTRARLYMDPNSRIRSDAMLLSAINTAIQFLDGLGEEIHEPIKSSTDTVEMPDVYVSSIPYYSAFLLFNQRKMIEEAQAELSFFNSLQKERARDITIPY